MKSIFEQIGGTYTKQGDYCLPNLYLPPEEERPIGIYGQRRLRYLKQHHKILYYNLLTSGKLHSHLADVEEEAQALFSRLVKEYAEKEGVTEQLKSADQMKWVQKMNSIRVCVTGSVIRELIVKAKLFCPEIAGLFCRIAGLFCHDSRANLSLKPVCFGIAIS